ncbi:YsnF/AvaK domain-containing protein [Nostoc sp. CALU 1950]|uniref:YsnF/AvaK domain-containing protein n=1 Tax=Nostoc sp. CALU 1950 TaxID=3104321 RepID=UPI003EBA2F17
MNSQLMAKNIRQTNGNPGTTSTSLAELRKKVSNFSVFDKEGQLVGIVHDLIVDANRRLNLVISRQLNQQTVEHGQQLADKHPSLFRLQSQRIKQIDKPNKSVFIDLNKSEIEYMPEYLETEKPGDSNSTEQLANNQTTNSLVNTVNLEQATEEQIIRLLEERLVVESSKRKVGEVIVRKVIETRMIQVPVRREKLIVEQVSPEHKQLAEIDLGEGEIAGVDLTDVERVEFTTGFDSGLTVSSEFSSPKIASLLLNAIALEQNHGCKRVRVTIAVEDESHQKKYQEWFDRCSKGQSLKPEK